jgi:predicted GIY-YIG superfamily endonuclease
MGIIYCLTFPNGKKYIGQTIQQLKARLQQHSKQKYCKAVYNAIQKYKDYKCDILLEVDNTFQKNSQTMKNTI